MLPYTTYLIDLDGVIYRGNELLPGAKAFITWLDTHGKKYLFLTNNSFASTSQVLDKLTELGITTTLAHILSAGQAAVQYIERRFPAATVYLVGEQPMIDLLNEHHLKVADVGTPYADVVLVGLDRHFDYMKLTEAILAIRAGAAFITVNRDALLPVIGGVLPGCGTMTAAIETGCGVTPEVIGKPEPTMLEEAMHLLNSQPDETVMIGDTLNVDILGGKRAHTATIFVLSGSNTREDAAKSSAKPDYIYEDVAAILDELEKG